MNYANPRENTSVYDDVDINALMILVWNQELEQHQTKTIHYNAKNENHQDEDDCQSYFPNALPLVHDTTPSAHND